MTGDTQTPNNCSSSQATLKPDPPSQWSHIRLTLYQCHFIDTMFWLSNVCVYLDQFMIVGCCPRCLARVAPPGVAGVPCAQGAGPPGGHRRWHAVRHESTQKGNAQR